MGPDGMPWTLNLQWSPCVRKVPDPFPPQKCSEIPGPYFYLLHFKASVLSLCLNLNPTAISRQHMCPFLFAHLLLKEASPRLAEGNNVPTQSSATAFAEQNTPDVMGSMLLPSGNVGCTQSFRWGVLECVASLTLRIGISRSPAKTIWLPEPT